MGDRFLSKYSKTNLLVIPDLIRNLNLKDGKQITGKIPTFSYNWGQAVEMTEERYSNINQES